MDGYGLGVNTTISTLTGYFPTLGKDAALIVAAMITMGLGISVFRKGLHWFRGFVK